MRKIKTGLFFVEYLEAITLVDEAYSLTENAISVEHKTAIATCILHKFKIFSFCKQISVFESHVCLRNIVHFFLVLVDRYCQIHRLGWVVLFIIYLGPHLYSYNSYLSLLSHLGFHR